jgi:hypothetical protein
LIHVEVSDAAVIVDSPVPALLELPGRTAQRLAAGKHEIQMT